jgi:hypothetical protein
MTLRTSWLHDYDNLFLVCEYVNYDERVQDKVQRRRTFGFRYHGIFGSSSSVTLYKTTDHFRNQDCSYCVRLRLGYVAVF